MAAYHLGLAELLDTHTTGQLILLAALSRETAERTRDEMERDTGTTKRRFQPPARAKGNVQVEPVQKHVLSKPWKQMTSMQYLAESQTGGVFG